VAGKLSRGRRMVLPMGAWEDDVEEFAQRLGRPRRADNPADEEKWIPRQVMWHADSGAIINYGEDLPSGLPFVVIMSEDPGELREDIELTETVLNTWRIPDLLQEVDASGAENLAEAILRMGLGAPREYDSEFFNRVVRGLSGEDDDVVKAALLAIMYEPWPEYREPVMRLLEGGASGEVAETAQWIIEQFEERDGQ
jgi:hypothetical protein